MSQHVQCDRCGSRIHEHSQEYTCWIGREYRELCGGCRLEAIMAIDRQAGVPVVQPGTPPHLPTWLRGLLGFSAY